MPVYLIQAGGAQGAVKIGFATNVRLRLIKMQTDNHERLSVLRIIEGDKHTERRLHLRFEMLWLHGDWHRFTDEMLGDLSDEPHVPQAAILIEPAIVAPPIRKLIGEPRSFHHSVIRAAGGERWISDALVVPHETVRYWRKRQIPPKYWHRLVEMALPRMPGLTIADLARTSPPP